MSGNADQFTIKSREKPATCVHLPLRLESTLNKREHWAKRHRRSKAERHAVGYALQARPSFERELPCTILLTRIAPRSLDGDNLQGAAKACRDAIAAYLGVDDADPRVRWEYAQRKDKVYGLMIEWRAAV